MLYAPDLGQVGLDVDNLMTRYETFCQEIASDGDMSEETLCRDMDEVTPFHSETIFHRVYSITVGKEHRLQ